MFGLAEARFWYDGARPGPAQSFSVIHAAGTCSWLALAWLFCCTSRRRQRRTYIFASHSAKDNAILILENCPLQRTMELDGMNDVRRLKVPAAIKIHRVATFPLHNFIPAIKTTSSRLPHITSRHLPSSIQFVQTAPAHTTGSVLFLPKILLLYFYIPQLTRIHNHHHFIPSCPD